MGIRISGRVILCRQLYSEVSSKRCYTGGQRGERGERVERGGLACVAFSDGMIGTSTTMHII